MCFFIFELSKYRNVHLDIHNALIDHKHVHIAFSLELVMLKDLLFNFSL